MTPKSIFMLAVCLMLWAAVIYKVVRRAPEPLTPMFTNVPTSQAEWEHQLMASGDLTPAQASNYARLAMEATTNTLWVSNVNINVGFPSRHRANASTDPDAERIVAELVAEGFSPEDAAEAYRLVNESANERRTNRMQWIGVRTNIDAKRWPIFEE